MESRGFLAETDLGPVPRSCSGAMKRTRGQQSKFLLTCIGIVRPQTARCFVRRTALSLAKLYESTNRTADGPGFSATPEFCESHRCPA
jgi:hypothetical protein